MKSGELIIDDVDVYDEYGVYVVTGGWNDLVSFPPLKAIDYNDWHEENGIEPDLSDPKLNTREVSMKFASVGDYIGFVAFLLAAPKHTFNCAAIGRTFILRLVQQPNLTRASELGSFTLKLADDEPMDRTTHTRVTPSSSVPSSTKWKIDSRNLTTYGIRVLAGSLAEVQKAPAVKLNLLRNIKTQTGASYDGMTLTKQSKDVKLTCLMRANSLTQFWNNHDTFLYDLIQPSERNLYCADAGTTLKCYYKSSSVSEFFPEGKPWMKFTLTMCITKP